MLIGLLGDVLLVTGVTALILLHLIARDVQRVRWRREFDGWRVLQRDRIAQHRMALSLHLAGHVECRSGWTGLQRQRLARRRCDRASW